MAKKKKYYVVWKGRETGIYDNWRDCEKQVKGVAAQYKSFDSLEEAERAFRQPYSNMIAQGQRSYGHPGKEGAVYVDANGMTAVKPGTPNPPILDALAVDAACSGNPGVMEYQGVYVATRSRVFHYRAEKGTNNIGEFLALVHGLSYLKKHHLKQVLYSDSLNAINWVRQKQCKSKLPVDDDTAALWDYIHRAEEWLRCNTYSTEIRKWDTDHWGEIPADFGRK
ncbi:MAG: ribonuclease HI [bacterium P3]|nr:MAG: ribonuclease HI [bacterium P3]KWW40771.1 MAG: ribonuclease HI [bacterium F083]